jgi:hypothetical protein
MLVDECYDDSCRRVARLTRQAIIDPDFGPLDPRNPRDARVHEQDRPSVVPVPDFKNCLRVAHNDIC